MPPTESPAPVVSARRRLLGGAFGVPAALALHSGGAFAASNCAARQLSKVAREVPSVIGDAAFARVPLYENANGNKLYLSGASLEAIALSVPGVRNASGIGATKYRRVEISGATAIVGGSDISLAQAPVKSNTRFLVVRFAAGPTPGTVDVLGVFDSQSTVSGTALTGTCWFSFETAAKTRSL